MPYKKREPVSESEMDLSRWQGHHTICQFIRDIYHMTDDPKIRYKLRVTMAMAKAMNNRIQWCKHEHLEHIPHDKPVEEVDDVINS